MKKIKSGILILMLIIANVGIASAALDNTTQISSLRSSMWQYQHKLSIIDNPAERTLGTYNYDVKGWIKTTTSGASSGDVSLVGGKIRLRVYKCAEATLVQQAVLSKTLSFDSETQADSWPELAYLKVSVDGKTIIDDSIPMNSGTLEKGQYLKSARSYDVSGYSGKTAIVVYSLYGSSYCGNDDHFYTYVSLSNFNYVPVPPATAPVIPTATAPVIPTATAPVKFIPPEFKQLPGFDSVLALLGIGATAYFVLRRRA